MTSGRIAGRAIPFGRANVDTDQIIPSRYLKTISREGLAEGAFAPVRSQPGNPFDDPAFAGAPILIAGANFGCGSSREHAVWALQQIGIEAVIAPGFGDIFEQNALRNGLLTVRLRKEEVELLLGAAAEGGEIAIDLVEESVTAPDGERFRFTIDPFSKHRLIHGVDDIALTLQSEQAIVLYEQRQSRAQPWQLSVHHVQEG